MVAREGEIEGGGGSEGQRTCCWRYISGEDGEVGKGGGM